MEQYDDWEEIELLDDSDKYKAVSIRAANKLFPAGRYYVGDLCYLLDKGEDYGVLKSIYFHYVCGYVCGTDYRRKKRFVECEDISFLAYFGVTAHGDGGFKDNQGRSYSVDAGLIGIVELTDSDLEASARAVEARGSGQVIDFGEAFEVSSKRGVFNFGDIEINTR